MSLQLLLRRALPLYLCVGALGCAPGGDLPEIEDVDSDESALSEATITFDASWGENVTGALVEGGTLHIDYDDARLAECRAWQGQTPQYAVTAHARFADGSEDAITVTGLSASSDPSFTIPVTGEVQIWFEATNRWGCHAWDSNLGDNYRFRALEEATRPDWLGNAASVVSRQTCDNGGACDSDRKALESGVSYDTWARQRAAIRSIFFDVWEPGVTDFDNANLWQQLDAQVHYRWSGQTSFQSQYVNFSRRVGNDARYELALRPFDPMHGNVISDPETQCPEGELTPSADGFYVSTTLELYFTVNGKELRPAGGGTYRVVYTDYRERYEVCLSQ